jgi:hypothetical protein
MAEKSENKSRCILLTTCQVLLDSDQHKPPPPVKYCWTRTSTSRHHLPMNAVLGGVQAVFMTFVNLVYSFRETDELYAQQEEVTYDLSAYNIKC